MQIKRILTACFVGCTSLAVTATAALAQLFVVSVDDLNVRSGPGTNFPATYVLRQGDVVEVTQRQGNWAFIVGERGGEGWVFAQFLSAQGSSPAPSPQPELTNDVFQSTGTVDNARYSGAGTAQLVIVRRDNDGALMLNDANNRVSIEYIGSVRSNFEGAVQLEISQFRSSEMGYRTVPASGTCDIQTTGGTGVRRAFCTVSGAGIDHGRSNFTGQ
ncbi:MAG: SH3 domain-containing protein [Kaiparowitsia implicata GSE-PSE-MK54-09C]|jgi:SH3-like domain-containing protein|nr:SH3 domain-containing protein [Kaiparowitsia implicata GSE-PSE-MK54-09C]